MNKNFLIKKLLKNSVLTMFLSLNENYFFIEKKKIKFNIMKIKKNFFKRILNYIIEKRKIIYF
jgi:hypothetical protein